MSKSGKNSTQIASEKLTRYLEIQRIRKTNPFCDDAPEKFGAMSVQDAILKYPHFFLEEDDWRLPTKDDSPSLEKFLDQAEAIYVKSTESIS